MTTSIFDNDKMIKIIDTYNSIQYQIQPFIIGYLKSNLPVHLN